MTQKVLIIDDTSVIRELLKDVLTDFGFRVMTAENGQEGVELVRIEDFVMVFCDVHMPIMGGLQTVLNIKKIKPEIPIIMTDSFPDKEAEKAQQAGAVKCLAKPFDLDDLRAVIMHLLGKKEVKTS
ncbi:MAG: response regulator [candidate division Zixibacteria bacterium]|nr:response regulator [candidate division Zixibacteria bacterium]